MTDPNSSAYPALHSIDGNWVKEPLPQYGGLTKRELFAAMAMQGMLADHTCDAEPDAFAEVAVNYADALIAELNKEAP